MNKDILYKINILQVQAETLLEAVMNLKKAIENEGKEKAWFDNGKVIINGVEYPIANFTVEWHNKDLE